MKKSTMTSNRRVPPNWNIPGRRPPLLSMQTENEEATGINVHQGILLNHLLILYPISVAMAQSMK
jgi:hypothetical protein